MYLYRSNVSYGGGDKTTGAGIFDDFSKAVNHGVDLAIEEVKNFTIDGNEEVFNKFKKVLKDFKKNNDGSLVDYMEIDESEGYSVKFYYYGRSNETMHIEMYNGYDYLEITIANAELNEVVLSY